MIDTMNINVTTPTLTPRIVNAERNLFAHTVSAAIRADSLMSSIFKVKFLSVPVVLFFVLRALFFAVCVFAKRVLRKEVLAVSERAKDKGQRTKGRYSDLSASIGSSLAARQAGHSPLTIPTTEDTPTPNTAEVTLISNG